LLASPPARRCPRSFAFYLADPISSIHEFAPIDTQISRFYTKRFSSCFNLLKFVTIRLPRRSEAEAGAIRVTDSYSEARAQVAKKIHGTLDSHSFSRLYENKVLVKSKSFPITSVPRNRTAPHLLSGTVYLSNHFGSSQRPFRNCSRTEGDLRHLHAPSATAGAIHAD